MRLVTRHPLDDDEGDYRLLTLGLGKVAIYASDAACGILRSPQLGQLEAIELSGGQWRISAVIRSDATLVEAIAFGRRVELAAEDLQRTRQPARSGWTASEDAGRWFMFVDVAHRSVIGMIAAGEG
jgi:hypothetical protein